MFERYRDIRSIKNLYLDEFSDRFILKFDISGGRFNNCDLRNSL